MNKLQPGDRIERTDLHAYCHKLADNLSVLAERFRDGDNPERLALLNRHHIAEGYTLTENGSGYVVQRPPSRRFTLELWHDTDACNDNPLEWTGAKILTFNRRSDWGEYVDPFSIGFADGGGIFDEEGPDGETIPNPYRADIAEGRAYMLTLPLDLTDDEERCRGLLTLENETLSDEQAQGILETYKQWARGEVYGFVLTDEWGEDVDSCWGFYDVESIAEQVRQHVTDEATLTVTGDAKYLWEGLDK
jgi:hypothetical protein